LRADNIRPYGWQEGIFFGTVKTVLYGEMAAQQKRSGGRGKMKIRCRPERRRLRFGIAFLSVEPFVPFEGDSSCGSNAGVESVSLAAVPPFLCAVKEMVVH